ncbi:PilW family protein [Roseateles sp. DB2]|uniref:PilW family protein n=1 Tax=Roseateles sp. DB2 TaxID=3453717 RepID=UPI003EE9CA2D
MRHADPAWPSPHSERASRTRQAGWTLVDLLVGMGLGLFLCALAGALMLSQWREHKHLLAETLLQQELRNAMALMRHEVHRSGADPAAHARIPERGGAAVTPTESPQLQLLLEGSPIADERTGNGLSLGYRREDPDKADRRLERGLRLQGTQLQYLLERSWQPWTDSNTVRFIGLELRLGKASSTLPVVCACAMALAPCDARLQTQVLHVRLIGQSRLDSRTVRSLSSSIHVRNKRLERPEEPC